MRLITYEIGFEIFYKTFASAPVVVVINWFTSTVWLGAIAQKQS